MAWITHQLAAITTKKYDFGGTILLVIFFWASLVPSLLPRPWYLQILVSVIVSVIGYGIGHLLSAIFHPLLHGHRWPFYHKAGRNTWTVVIGLTAVILGYQLIASAVWQHEMYRLIGSTPKPSLWFTSTVLVLLGTLLLTGLSLYLFAELWRLIRRLMSWLKTKRFVQALPKGYERSLAALIILIVLALVANNLNSRLLDGLVDLQYQTQNNIIPDGYRQPRQTTVSGSPPSISPWDQLGYQGRKFVASAPSAAHITAVTGQPAEDPIRIYVGLKQTADLTAQTRLAIRELQRTHAFDRKIIQLVVATGSGWVDPKSTGVLEYLANGDIATVTIQYSYFPSWISFLHDHQRASQAATVSLQQISAAVAAQPAGQRPQLYLFAESLGSYGAESALLTHPAMNQALKGTLFVGPPGFNPLHEQLTAQRLPSSPSYWPAMPDGQTVFITNVAQLSYVTTQPQRIYLQNPTDPVSKWNTAILWTKPAWLDEEKRDHLIAPHFFWVPVVTFFQVTVDMILSGTTPPGSGHTYGTNALGAWEILTGIHIDHVHELAINRAFSGLR